MANWNNLPLDLWGRISDFCIFPDHIRMQLVCKSWGSILKKIIPRELPLLMMLPNNNKEEEEEDDDDDGPDARDFFSLTKQKIHTIRLPHMRGKRCCGSFQNGWLMTVDNNLDISIFHPWSKKKLNLPHQSKFENRNYIDENNNDNDDDESYSIEEMRDLEIFKAAMSNDCKTVVIIYGLGNLCFWRIGDDAYTELDTDALMEDVIYHKGLFYSINQQGGIYLIHIGEDGSQLPHMEKLSMDLDPLPYTTYSYLVPDILTDGMFVITRNVERTATAAADTTATDSTAATATAASASDSDTNQEKYPPHKTIHFDIFFFPLEREREKGASTKTLKKFTKVESLGDRALFLGLNSPFIVRASQFPGFIGNCIYFADNVRERHYHTSHGCCDSGIFRPEDGTVEELFVDRFHPTISPPLWIATPPYPSLLRDSEDKLFLEEHHDVST